MKEMRAVIWVPDDFELRPGTAQSLAEALRLPRTRNADGNPASVECVIHPARRSYWQGV